MKGFEEGEQPDANKPFWTVKETAAFLGLAVSAIHALIGAGKITIYRFGPNGGRIKIKPADVMAYVERCRYGAKVETRVLSEVEVPPLVQGLDHFAKLRRRPG